MHQNWVQTIEFDPLKGGGGKNSCKATEFATIQSAAAARYKFKYKVQRNLRKELCKMRHPSFLQQSTSIWFANVSADRRKLPLRCSQKFLKRALRYIMVNRDDNKHDRGQGVEDFINGKCQQRSGPSK